MHPNRTAVAAVGAMLCGALAYPTPGAAVTVAELRTADDPPKVMPASSPRLNELVTRYRGRPELAELQLSVLFLVESVIGGKTAPARIQLLRKQVNEAADATLRAETRSAPKAAPQAAHPIRTAPNAELVKAVAQLRSQVDLLVGAATSGDGGRRRILGRNVLDALIGTVLSARARL